jgi:transposase
VVDRTPTNYGTPWTMVAMVATIRVGGVQAPWLLAGAMDGAAFDTYVTHVLAPTLQPGDIVVWDNLAAHQQASVQATVEAHGARVEGLSPSPYSLDFRP